MTDGEEHVISDVQNPLNGAVGFVFTILVTLVLSTLVQGFAANVGAVSAGLGLLFVALTVETLVAAFDNYMYTQKRANLLHRGILGLEVVRYAVHFTSVVALFLGTRAVILGAKGTITPATAGWAALVVVLYRYVSEWVWQAVGLVRGIRLAGTLSLAELDDPYSAEAKRYLRPYLTVVVVLAALATVLYGRPAVQEAFVRVPAVGPLATAAYGLFPHRTLLSETLPAVAIVGAKWYYLRFWWQGYYREVLGADVSLRGATPAHLRRLAERGVVPTGTLARELKLRHDDPSSGVSIETGENEQFDTIADREGMEPTDLLAYVDFPTTEGTDDVRRTVPDGDRDTGPNERGRDADR